MVGNGNSSEEMIIPTIDSHIHFVDFVQKTNGMDELLEGMDNSNVKKAVLFGVSIIQKWNAVERIAPVYYLDDDSKCYYYSRTDEIVAEHYLRLSQKNQQRIAPCICGFNPTDMFAVEYVKEMFEKYPFFKGVGEIFFRHDDLTRMTMGEIARPNHPAMLRVYEFCSEKQLPFLLHHNSMSVGGKEDFKYMSEFTEILKKFQNVDFVWAHVGISRRIYHENYHTVIDSTLTQNQNLYIDLSWLVYDEVICENGIPKEEWLEVFKKHSDKVMIGSDLLGDFKDVGKVMARYNKFLSMLPEDAAKKIAYTNAHNLWFSTKEKERIDHTSHSYS